jgi:hypothetical protein
MASSEPSNGGHLLLSGVLLIDVFLMGLGLVHSARGLFR